jgi:hypothetical protein
MAVRLNTDDEPAKPMEQELIQLVALPLLAASLPPVNASNTGRRQWLSYFGFSTVEGYDCLAFAGCIERNGCGNHRHSNDDPKHDLLFHDRLPEAPAVDHVADGCTEDNPPPPNHQLANHTVKPGNAYIGQVAALPALQAVMALL